MAPNGLSKALWQDQKRKRSEKLMDTPPTPQWTTFKYQLKIYFWLERRMCCWTVSWQLPYSFTQFTHEISHKSMTTYIDTAMGMTSFKFSTTPRRSPVCSRVLVHSPCFWPLGVSFTVVGRGERYCCKRVVWPCLSFRHQEDTVCFARLGVALTSPTHLFSFLPFR